MATCAARSESPSTWGRDQEFDSLIDEVLCQKDDGHGPNGERRLSECSILDEYMYIEGICESRAAETDGLGAVINRSWVSSPDSYLSASSSSFEDHGPEERHQGNITSSKSSDSISGLVVSELSYQESRASIPVHNTTSIAEGKPPCNDFPLTLHRLLSENKWPDIVSWQRDGKAFIIHDKEAFEMYILPTYFSKLRKIDSFHKQLKRYRFAVSSISGRFGGKWTLCWSPEFHRDGGASVCMMEPNAAIERKRKRLHH